MSKNISAMLNAFGIKRGMLSHSVYYHNLNVINRIVPKGVFIYCICLGEDASQLNFLMVMILLLRPEAVYVYDNLLSRKFITSLKELSKAEQIPMRIKLVNDVPRVFSSPTLVYAPYCPDFVISKILLCNINAIEKGKLFFVGGDLRRLYWRTDNPKKKKYMELITAFVKKHRFLDEGIKSLDIDDRLFFLGALLSKHLTWVQLKKSKLDVADAIGFVKVKTKLPKELKQFPVNCKNLVKLSYDRKEGTETFYTARSFVET